MSIIKISRKNFYCSKSNSFLGIPWLGWLNIKHGFSPNFGRLVTYIYILQIYNFSLLTVTSFKFNFSGFLSSVFLQSLMLNDIYFKCSFKLWTMNYDMTSDMLFRLSSILLLKCTQSRGISNNGQQNPLLMSWRRTAIG